MIFKGQRVDFEEVIALNGLSVEDAKDRLRLAEAVLKMAEEAWQRGVTDLAPTSDQIAERVALECEYANAILVAENAKLSLRLVEDPKFQEILHKLKLAQNGSLILVRFPVKDHIDVAFTTWFELEKFIRATKAVLNPDDDDD